MNTDIQYRIGPRKDGVNCIWLGHANVVIAEFSRGTFNEARDIGSRIEAAPALLDALVQAERFIAGFEDDDVQEVAPILNQVRTAIESASSWPPHLAPEFIDAMKQIANEGNQPARSVYKLWQRYSKACENGDQCPILREFVQWHQRELGLSDAARVELQTSLYNR